MPLRRQLAPSPQPRHHGRHRSADTPRQHRRRNEAFVHGLRHERNHWTSAAGRARWVEAGAPSRAVRHEDHGPGADAGLPQVREDRRRGDGQFPSPRRPVDLRHAGAVGAGLQHALSAGRRPGQLRLDGRRPARGDALYRGAAQGAGRRVDGGPGQGDRRLRAELRRDHRRAVRSPGTVSAGIAVGMAPNAPPHNLREVIDGCIWLIESTHFAEAGARPTRSDKLRNLIRLIPAPDFPTAGLIVGRQGAVQAYTTGRGSILMRARCEVETNKKGDRQAIIVTEIPYQVNKAKLIERVAELVREKTIEGISDLRDESDRDGMRIVIELKRGEVPEVILNNLYKHTQLQLSFGIIMLAIVGGRPRVMTLLELIESFVEFRRDVVRRRTEFELRKAEARYHILEGLKIALDHLDAVITLIRGSRTPSEARDGLITQFGLSPIQSQAILDMQLQRLTGLERQKILDELADLLKTIERLRAILASERLLMQIIVDELKAVREKYGDDRRTEIVEGESGEINVEDLIAEEDMAISVSNTGYIKRTAITTYRSQRRGGKGRIGMRTRDEDFVSHLFVASTHAY